LRAGDVHESGQATWSLCGTKMAVFLGQYCMPVIIMQGDKKA